MRGCAQGQSTTFDNISRAHIELCKSLIKETGKVYFKVWPGNCTGIGTHKADSFQSNRDYLSYVPEVRYVFGRRNVEIDYENEIIVAKNCNPIFH